MNIKLRRLAVASLIFLSGCGLFEKKRDQAVVRPVSHEPGPLPTEPRPKMLAIANGNTSPNTPLADPVRPPPPDEQIFEAIPPVNPKDTAVVAQPKATGADPTEVVVPAMGIAPPMSESPMLVQSNVKPPVEQSKPVEQPKKVAETPLQSMKRLQQLAAEKLARLEGFEAKLIRKETIPGKTASEPKQEIQFKFRAQPLSLHLKWVGEEATGRELVYAGGRKEEKVEILPARSDGFLIAGKRMSFNPGDSMIRSQSRYDLREGGMQMAVVGLGKSMIKADRDPKVAANFRYLGIVNRRERQGGFEATEETIPPGVEPAFPKGGKRTLHFDPEPTSPSYGLPVLVTATDEANREVEYYFFDQLKPARFTDADFDANVLLKKK